MTQTSISVLTICGLEELDYHSARGVSHVLSILDPDWPVPEAFWAYDAHHRTTLHFHDIIDVYPDRIMPAIAHMEEILRFGRSLGRANQESDPHLLVHCHMGVSRSTAAVAAILAQEHPSRDEDELFGHLAEVRPQIWPNSVMISHADELLGRDGRLVTALRRLYGRQLARRPEQADYLRRYGRAREVDMAIFPVR
jgi:predicted protein tyrosine phosphatase